MDDSLVFGESRADLKATLAAMREFLEVELRLRLKEKVTATYATADRRPLPRLPRDAGRGLRGPAGGLPAVLSTACGGRSGSTGRGRLDGGGARGVGDEPDRPPLPGEKPRAAAGLLRPRAAHGVVSDRLTGAGPMGSSNRVNRGGSWNKQPAELPVRQPQQERPGQPQQQLGLPSRRIRAEGSRPVSTDTGPVHRAHSPASGPQGRIPTRPAPAGSEGERRRRFPRRPSVRKWPAVTRAQQATAGHTRTRKWCPSRCLGPDGPPPPGRDERIRCCR